MAGMDKTGVNFTVLGDTYHLDNLLCDSLTYEPCLYYYNGATYCVLPKLNNNTYKSEPVVFKHLNSDSSLQIVETGIQVVNNDYHNVPSIAVDNSGYIYITQDNLLQLNRGRVYKSNASENIAAFTVSSILLGVSNYANTAYPIMFIDNTGKVVHVPYYSEGSDTIQRIILISDPGNTNWNYSQFGLSRCVPVNGYPDSRHYLSVPYGGSNCNGWNYFLLRRRTTKYDGTQFFNKFYVLKTQDFKTFYNQNSSFSKNVQSLGYLTENELDTNFLHKEYDLKETPTISVAECVSPTGYVYTALRNTSNSQHIFVFWDTNQYKQKHFPIPSISGKTWNKCYAIMSYDDNTFEAWHEFTDNTTTLNELHRFRTTDKFDTLSYVDNWLDFVTGVSATRIKLPSNFHQIPVGTKFLCLSQSDKDKGIVADDQAPTTSNNAYFVECVKIA